ncbi:MAG: hypothetical protein FWD61_14150 [Phycisphaerales bacterium]|nr:hypothetical protein [Phycisphaerales bacterium]
MAQAVATDVMNVMQFGVAGIMGALWWWERRYSRQREDQLTEAHEALMAKQEHLDALLAALNGNTKVIAEFTSMQGEILRALKANGGGTGGGTA